MDKSNLHYQVTSITLKELFPDELFLLGPAVLEDLLEGYSNFKQTQKGSNLDQSAVVNLIASSVALITAAIELYIVLKKDLGRKPSISEIKESVNEKTTSISVRKFSDDELELLINTTVKNIEKLEKKQED